MNHAAAGSGNSTAGSNNGNASGAAVASAAQRAITKNPAAASRLLAAGINHANNSPGSGTGNASTAGGGGNNDHAQALNPGRVAAAAHAFSGPPKPSTSVAQKGGPEANKFNSHKVRISVVFRLRSRCIVRKSVHRFHHHFIICYPCFRHAKIYVWWRRWAFLLEIW